MPTWVPAARWTPLGAVLAASSLGAQAPDLKALLDTRVEVATQYPLSARESPGIVTVLRRDEIRASGARDLLELLRRVPGFDFGSDTNGVVGIGVRTAWGHDGKVLLLVDGLEMNEPLYGTTPYGGHVLLANVDRIEIIRGPGSVLYGGFAELAVIHVFTRRGSEVDGLAGDLWLGRMSGSDQPTRQGEVTFGKAWGDQEVSLSIGRAMVPRGVGPRVTPSGSVEAGDADRLAQTWLNLGYSLGDLNVRFIHDAYAVGDYTREYKPTFAWLTFPSDLLGLDYTWTSGDWTVQPRVSLKGQSPWNYTDSRTDRNTRLVGGLATTWAATSTVKLSLGVEAIQDDSNIFWSRLGLRQHYVYEHRAGTAQVLWTSGFGNLDLGVRYDHNSEYGSATSPRLAYTRATEEGHVKLLVAGAFRAPSIENLFVNPLLKPERTQSFEAEVGRALSPAVYASLNAFVIRIHDPISYASPAPSVNTYLNFDYTGAQGLEFQVKGRTASLSVEGSLSYAQARDREAAFYRVEGKEGHHVGFAPLKAAFQVQWRFSEGWSFNPSLILYGPRYGYRYGETVPAKFHGTGLLDLYLTRTFGRGAELGLRVGNVTDAAVPFIQPYGIPGVGGNAPLPGPGREVDLHFGVRF